MKNTKWIILGAVLGAIWGLMLLYLADRFDNPKNPVMLMARMLIAFPLYVSFKITWAIFCQGLGITHDCMAMFFIGFPLTIITGIAIGIIITLFLLIILSKKR